MKKQNTKTIRKLKIYTRLSNPKYSQPVLIPEILLKGNWLKKWGFECGDEIKIVKTKVGISIINSKEGIQFVVL